MTQGRGRVEKILQFDYKFGKFALNRPKQKLFVNKITIKSNFGNYTNKVGNLQIIWERLREFCLWAWEFLQFGSSHTDSEI